MTLSLRRFASADPDFEARLRELRHWPADADAAIEGRVAQILADVRSRGDEALLEHTARLDGLRVASAAALEIGSAELQAALAAIPAAQREALQAAATRVRRYHERQLAACGLGWSWRDEDGSLLGQKVAPLDRVGIYVPGGKAAYPSSVLMNAIPAQVAGVREIVMVSPTPVRDGGSVRGERNPLVLAAAALAGVHRVFTVGGAQAVAALAYGTATIPKVDKITGPGNAYVAAAKRRVFGEVGIDMIAGPSEVLVLADGSTTADWVAMDLFSQAEHDELAQSILLSPDAAYLDAVHAAMQRLLPEMPRAAVIRASLEGRGALIHTRSMEEACEISNRIAPEHLEISSRNPWRWVSLLRHAGAIFVGAWSSETLGDYCAGPDHVLPTSGTARFSSPLGVYDFQKRTSLIEVSAAGAQVLGPVAVVLAEGEGLRAHARAAEMRLTGAATAPQAAALDVRAVTEANMDELMKLAVAPHQTGFVASNTRSLAQAAYRSAGRPLGLYADGQPVGFLLLWDARCDPEEPKDELYIWRLMIDAAHQGKGHGKSAMQWVIEEARRMGVARVALSHAPENDAAGGFYEKLGFTYSGRLLDDEREMVYPLSDGAST